MSKVKNENYINVAGWMINDLGLKGNELLVYAIIYGFSQAESQVFSGSLQYLADWTNSTKQGVIKNLQSLVEKGYIVKKDTTINGVKFCEYYTTEFNTVLNKVDGGIKQSLMGGIKESLTNNIDQYKKEDNKEDIYVSEFEYLWNLYPNKKGKQNALKAYIKARKDGIDKNDIMVGLNNYIAYIKAERIEDKFIKHGSTWFNQKCWNDDYTITRKPTTKDLAQTYDFSDMMDF